MGQKSSLAAEAAPRCTACGSAEIIKNGRNVCGSQQFRCKACGACRVLRPKSPTASPERQAEILRAVEVERLSLRAAERIFHVARHTVAGWLKKKPRACRP